MVSNVHLILSDLYAMAKEGVLDVQWLIDRKNDKMGAYDLFARVSR